MKKKQCDYYKIKTIIAPLCNNEMKLAKKRKRNEKEKVDSVQI